MRPRQIFLLFPLFHHLLPVSSFALSTLCRLGKGSTTVLHPNSVLEPWIVKAPTIICFRQPLECWIISQVLPLQLPLDSFVFKYYYCFKYACLYECMPYVSGDPKGPVEDAGFPGARVVQAIVSHTTMQGLGTKFMSLGSTQISLLSCSLSLIYAHTCFCCFD